MGNGQNGQNGEHVPKNVNEESENGQEVARREVGKYWRDPIALGTTLRLKVLYIIHVTHLLFTDFLDCMIATYYARNKKCYRRFGPVKSFPKARKHCVDLGPGGELASISDEETQTFLLEEISNSFWTGGTADDGLTGVSWRWLDGTPWSFEDWRTFHPKVGIDQRLFFNAISPRKWESRPWTDEASYLCQYDYEADNR